MARPVRGAEVLEMAQEMILRAKTIDELRQAQAVVLPLAHGLSLAETARAIGRSVVWTCRLRNRFLAGETVGDGQRRNPGHQADREGLITVIVLSGRQPREPRRGLRDAHAVALFCIAQVAHQLNGFGFRPHRHDLDRKSTRLNSSHG